MKPKGSENYDVLVVGGGVIGLSLAWELAQHGATVCLLDRGSLGNEASWAGAGMIPPGSPRSHWKVATPLEQLAGWSQLLHPQWHERLLELTGIDNEYQACGAIQLALTPNEASELDMKVAHWRQLGMECHELTTHTLCEIEPSLAKQATNFLRAVLLPEEAQIRNPRHLRALIAACQAEGVALRPNVEVQAFESRAERVLSVKTSEGLVTASQFCLTAGCWSGEIAKLLGFELPVRPIRGQIVLLNGQPGRLQRNINLDVRYLVPRQDGRVLVGSTQEDVGFVQESTADGEAELMSFAKKIAPELAGFPVESHWSGLRPATLDGLPYLGRIPQLENCWLATGHFRAGLQLAPATAEVMRALMLGQSPPLDVQTLGPTR